MSEINAEFDRNVAELWKRDRDELARLRADSARFAEANQILIVENTVLGCENDQLKADNTQLRKEVESLRADCAAMVKVIECAGSHDHSDGDEKDCVLCAAVNSVLDKPNCGTELLSTLDRYRVALESAKKFMDKIDSTFTGEMLDRHGCLLPLVDAVFALKAIDPIAATLERKDVE